jgi:hypothetical protein
MTFNDLLLPTVSKNDIIGTVSGMLIRINIYCVILLAKTRVCAPEKNGGQKLEIVITFLIFEEDEQFEGDRRQGFSSSLISLSHQNDRLHLFLLPKFQDNCRKIEVIITWLIIETAKWFQTCDNKMLTNVAHSVSPSAGHKWV